MKHSKLTEIMARGAVFVPPLLGGVLGLCLLGFYVLSIIWRVSIWEQQLYGGSCLLPLTLNPRKYDQPPIAESYGSGTYRVILNGKPVWVYKQRINGFQHAYGSALAAYEIGSRKADLLFRANEYLEAYCLKNGQTFEHYLDTKKDLCNNAIGRDVGQTARTLHLSYKDADTYMVNRILAEMDRGTILHHFLNPRVEKLPPPEQYGCPFLPNPARQGPS